MLREYVMLLVDIEQCDVQYRHENKKQKNGVGIKKELKLISTS